jgi:putative CocE/NonD family hydrolase
MISWYHLTAGHLLQNMDALDWDRLNWHLPLITMDQAAGRPNPRWRDIISHSRLDAWWDPMRYQNRIERVQVPVLHLTGWYDDAQRATPMNFIAMTQRAESPEARRRQKMVVGPWPHALNSTSKLDSVDFGPEAIIDLDGLERRWFDRWLRDQPNGIDREPPVRLFAMGVNRWIDAADWPVPGTRFVRYFLRSHGRANTRNGDGRLSLEPPGREPPDRYVSDPANPVPFLTAPSFAQLGAAEDYAEVETRSDVLVYTTEAFDSETLVCGPLRVRLVAASSAPDTDFMVKVLDVWPNGYVQRLNDGMVRARFRDGWDAPRLIEPGRAYEYDIDAWNTCQALLPGHRVRLEIASSAFPKFDRNPQTGDSLGMNARIRTAEQSIFHDGARLSYLDLPVVDRQATAHER